VVEDFRFLVAAVITIQGRGTTLLGVTQSGSVRIMDRVAVVHEGHHRVVTCRGVEMGNVHPPGDPRTIGLLLPELDPSEVADGDLVQSPEASTG
jgi:translation elongation factor EF-Tu-like GTPase